MRHSGEIWGHVVARNAREHLPAPYTLSRKLERKWAFAQTACTKRATLLHEKTPSLAAYARKAVLSREDAWHPTRRLHIIVCRPSPIGHRSGTRNEQ
jgi:hypothetical protein